MTPLTIHRCAHLAAQLDTLIDAAQTGDDPIALHLIRRASRRLHNRIEALQRRELNEALVMATEVAGAAE